MAHNASRGLLNLWRSFKREKLRGRARWSLSAPSKRLHPLNTCLPATNRQTPGSVYAIGRGRSAGTDSPFPGTTYGASLHRELEHLVNAGLTQTAALAAATSAPARAFRMSDRGGIRTGMRADLLLVDGDPSKQIRATRNIVTIWKRGVRVQRAAASLAP